MQVPPPVSSLLQQLATMAANVQSVLTESDVDWLWRPAEDEWSLTELICHLRDVECEVHQFRFRALIENDNPFITGVAADEWAESRNYKQQDGPSALQAYIQARGETLTMLDSLDEAMWARQGRHAFFGPTSTHEILYLAVRHDEIHWEQIKALLAGVGSSG